MGRPVRRESRAYRGLWALQVLPAQQVRPARPAQLAQRVPRVPRARQALQVPPGRRANRARREMLELPVQRVQWAPQDHRAIKVHKEMRVQSERQGQQEPKVMSGRPGHRARPALRAQPALQARRAPRVLPVQRAQPEQLARVLRGRASGTLPRPTRPTMLCRAQVRPISRCRPRPVTIRQQIPQTLIGLRSPWLASRARPAQRDLPGRLAQLVRLELLAPLGLKACREMLARLDPQERRVKPAQPAQ